MKKGFTLIELLAVIVILAVIALIATASIISIIDRAEKGALEDSAYGIIEAGNAFYIDHILPGSSNESYERINFEIMGGKFVNVKNKEEALEFKGSMPKTGKLQINANGDTAVAICSNKYCACKSIAETKVIVQKQGCEIDEDTGEIGKKKDTTPVGTVISYIIASTPPEGYLSCDGSIYKISEYPKLAEAIKKGSGSYDYFGGDGVTTFAVPDLRGEFLRGTGTANRNTGTGGNVGVHQEATSFASGYATSDNGNLYLPYNTSKTYVPQNYDRISSDSTKTSVFIRSTLENNLYRSTVGMITTRPTNTSVLYCIKY